MNIIDELCKTGIIYREGNRYRSGMRDDMDVTGEVLELAEKFKPQQEAVAISRDILQAARPLVNNLLTLEQAIKQ